jgi:hypothetical protein
MHVRSFLGLSRHTSSLSYTKGCAGRAPLRGVFGSRDAGVGQSGDRNHDKSIVGNAAALGCGDFHLGELDIGHILVVTRIIILHPRLDQKVFEMFEPKESVHRIIIELHWSRRVMFIISTVLLICAASLWVSVVLARSGQNTTPPPSLALTASTVVSYQGRVSVNGRPFNGMGQFKFAIVNADGTQAYWSNDGTGASTVPFTPTSSVTLNVASGLFDVLLGDTTLMGMTQPMRPDAFSTPDRLLRVWFNDGAHGFQQLTPDVRVASAPYALNAEFARTGPNLQRIAVLKWYTAISTTHSNYPVGSGPQGIAFDGANIWTANGGTGDISVLRASDGYRVMTVTVGSNPTSVTFDGVRMWVTNHNDSTLSVIRADDGSHVMTPTAGLNPAGGAFDGTYIWVTNYGNASINAIDPGNGAKVMTRTVGPNPTFIAFDGANLWVANHASNTVNVFRAVDGTPVMTPTVGSQPDGLAFDGRNMWVANSGDGTVSVLRAVDGFHVMTPTVGSDPSGIAFDGQNMWIANSGSLSGDTVTILRASDGAPIKTISVGVGPQAIAFDGVFMWITNYISNTVSKR